MRGIGHRGRGGDGADGEVEFLLEPPIAFSHRQRPIVDGTEFGVGRGMSPLDKALVLGVREAARERRCRGYS